MKESRPIEMGIAYMEGNAMVWCTEYIFVPLKTSDVELEEVGREVILEKWKKAKVTVGGTWLYWIVPEDEWDDYLLIVEDGDEKAESK